MEAVDIQTQNRVAIKIIRAIPKYRDASKIEIRVLQKLKERDPANVQLVCVFSNDLQNANILLLLFPVNASIYSTGLTTATTYAWFRNCWACVYMTF